MITIPWEASYLIQENSNREKVICRYELYSITRHMSNRTYTVKNCDLVYFNSIAMVSSCCISLILFVTKYTQY